MNIELPRPLHEHITAGGDPRSDLGPGFLELLDSLVDSLHLEGHDRARLADREMADAFEHASCHDLVPRATPLSVEAHRRHMYRARWAHDVLVDERSRDALLALLDRVEVAQVDIYVDHARRPAPLVGHTSTGEPCQSCGRHLHPGARMLSFELQGDPHPEVWTWCQSCVSTALNDAETRS